MMRRTMMRRTMIGISILLLTISIYNFATSPLRGGEHNLKVVKVSETTTNLGDLVYLIYTDQGLIKAFIPSIQIDNSHYSIHWYERPQDLTIGSCYNFHLFRNGYIRKYERANCVNRDR